MYPQALCTDVYTDSCLIIEELVSWGTTTTPFSWVNEPWNDSERSLPQGSLSPPKQDGLQFQVRPHHTLSSLPPYSFGNSHPTQQLNNLPWLSVLCILAFLFFFSVHHRKYYTKSASAVEFHILAHPGVPTVAVWDPCISMSFSIAKSFLTNRCLQQ